MKKLFFLLFPLVLLSSKCKDDDLTGTIALNIVAKYNSNPLIINKIYDYNGKKVRFTKLSFFVSDFKNSNGKVIGSLSSPQINNISLFDFADLTDSLSAIKGISKSVQVPVGNSDNLKMNIGVISINKPKDFPSTSPLSDAGYYWDSWNSYIFSKLEGLMDKDGDGKFETGITLHTGGNEVYQSLSFTKNTTVKANETTTVNFDLDVNKLINGIDLATINSTHQTGDLPTMKVFMGNFQSALTVK